MAPERGYSSTPVGIEPDGSIIYQDDDTGERWNGGDEGL